MLFRAPSMEAFNVGSDQAVSIVELAHAVSRALNSKAELYVAQEPVPGAPPRQYVPSIEKARQLLGLDVHVSLEGSIRRTAAWHGFRL